MGSSPPVCSFTASLIQVAHVESRCATIIYMNGIENFLLCGREKRCERVRNVDAPWWEKKRKRERRHGLSEAMKGERESRDEEGLCGRARSNGEGENLLAFYVSNYMKDGITQPTDRPTDRPTEPTLVWPPPPTRPSRFESTNQRASSLFSRRLNPL